MRPFTVSLLLLLAAPVAFSQTSETAAIEPKNPFKLPRFERTYGISYEMGRGGFYYTDTMGPPYDFGTPNNITIDPAVTNAYSLFYEQQINRKGWSYGFGIGLNASVTNGSLTYQNPAFLLPEPDGDYLVNYFDAKSHKIRFDVTAFSLDIPFTLSYAYRLRERSFVRPYAGLKVRNIIYFLDESSDKTFPARYRIGEYGSSIDGSVEVDYGTTGPTRAILFAFIGVKGSTMLNNGGAINYFADYNLSFFNHAKVYFSDFKSTEEVTKYDPDTGEQTLITYNFSLYSGMSPPLEIALKMSTVRVGVSYSLPAWKKGK